MKYPQAVVWESGSRLANLLRSRLGRRTWVLRQAANEGDCLAALADGCPNVLVVEIGENSLAVFQALERLRAVVYDASLAAVVDRRAKDPLRLAEYARCIGARVVVISDTWPSDLVEAVEALLRRHAATGWKAGP